MKIKLQNFPFCPQKYVSKCSPTGDKVLAVDRRRWNKVRRNHIATRRGVGEKKKRKTLSARSSGRARHFELQSINVEGSSACPLPLPTTTTFPNLYDTPHTSEKTAGITLFRRRRHTFPPRAVVFIRDPLLKAAQEFLMYSNVFATAVA